MLRSGTSNSTKSTHTQVSDADLNESSHRCKRLLVVPIMTTLSESLVEIQYCMLIDVYFSSQPADELKIKLLVSKGCAQSFRLNVYVASCVRHKTNDWTSDDIKRLILNTGTMVFREVANDNSFE